MGPQGKVQENLTANITGLQTLHEQKESMIKNLTKYRLCGIQFLGVPSPLGFPRVGLSSHSDDPGVGKNCLVMA